MVDPFVRDALLARWRGELGHQREVLQVWRGGGLTLRSNGEDITAQIISDLEAQIERLASLVERIEATDP